ncbi:substrate-binding domain-containing protein [Emticicia sp. CRIBPO]|uniref:LacI family DNA-binding transcriptional regulator n=1 Tax=Emticicia sp. CRIBPO TaxID=2683258 RepID=UPI001412E076|nr:LacI family DNA-binding transcriptional regulator [Emticicia sp. CRIBPO]NBA87526.1 substrate-binding domain-containing protein [Emticicia sp. CRIBPO]
MRGETTIYDIAKKLNLSPATISRALNDHPAINAKTKLTVNALAKELGYQSNKFASNLRKQKTNTIGIIVPRLNSALMSTVLAGMEKVANEAGYNLIISQSLESEKKEITNAKTMFNGRVDALLVSVAYDTDTFEHFSPFTKKGIPLLFFDRVIEHPSCTNIVIDNVKAGYDASRHLIEQGCRKLMHVTGNLKRNVYSDRFKGFETAIRENGLEFDRDLLMLTDFGQESGKDVVKRIKALPYPPDGIFITNDSCAVSCIDLLKKEGFSVPEDIAVVGFNNDPVATVVDPNLTTIHYPGKEMGEIAVQSIINHLNGTMDINPTNTIILRSELIIRGSSLKATTRKAETV